MRVLLIFIFLSVYCFAQNETENDEALQNLYETVIENSDENIVIDLADIQTFDMNKVNMFELLTLPFMNSFIAKNIINYRDSNKVFFSINELLNVEGITPDYLKILRNFLYIENKSNEEIKKFFNTKTETGYFTQLPISEEIVENKYEGGNYRLFNKIKMSYNDFYLNFITDKDIGEKDHLDFYGWNFSWRFEEKLKIILGDFKINFGQGLLFSSALGIFKSNDVIYSVKNRKKCLKENTSLSENAFFRGIAFESEFNNLYFSGFYSKNYADANLDTLNDLINSFYTSGYHRTENEKKKKNNIHYELFGFITGYSISDLLDIKLIYSSTLFSKNLKDGKNVIGNKFDNIGLSYNLNFSDFISFGEVGLSKKIMAMNLGFEKAITPKIHFLINFRNYPENFISLFGNSLKESSGKVQNELGIYNGMRIKLDEFLINSYFDIYKTYRPTYLNDFSSNGRDFLFDISRKFKNSFFINFRFRTEKKTIEKRLNDTSLIQNVLSTYLSSYRFRMEFGQEFLKNFIFKFRTEMVLIEIENFPGFERGILSNINLEYKINKEILTYLNVNLYKTDSYNSRIYLAQGGISNYLMSVAMYGEGLYFVTGATFRIKDFLSLYLNYSLNIKNYSTDKSQYFYPEENTQQKINLLIKINF